MKFSILLLAVVDIANAGALKIATFPVRHPVKVLKVVTFPVVHPVKTVRTIMW